MERMSLREVVPELFQLHRLFGLAIGPKQGDHLTKGGDARVLAAARGPDGTQYISDNVSKAISLKLSDYDELGQPIGSIQRDISAFSRGTRNIESERAQLLVERNAMSFGRDDNGSVACPESGADETAQVVQQGGVFRVKLNGVSFGGQIAPVGGWRQSAIKVGEGVLIGAHLLFLVNSIRVVFGKSFSCSHFGYPELVV